jgi:hypothetical protein
MAAFFDIVEGRVPDRHGWLAYVDGQTEDVQVVSQAAMVAVP